MTTSAPVMGDLRRATAEAHERIEKRVALDRIQSLHDYQRLLAAFYGFYEGTEPPIFMQPGLHEALPDLDERRKTEWLRQDLAAGGMNPEQLAAIPLCPYGSLSSVAEALGALYVMEGATLGGAVIGDTLHRRLGIDATRGGRFFWNYGFDRGAKWKRFGDCVSAFCAEHGEESALLQSAVQTFARFDVWFEQALA